MNPRALQRLLIAIPMSLALLAPAAWAGIEDPAELALPALGGPDPVHVTSAWSTTGARPGDRAVLALVIDIDPGYHINADAAQQGSTGDFFPYPTSVQVVEAHDALTLESARFPLPHPVRAEYVTGELMAFAGRTVLYVPMQVGEAAAGSSLPLAVLVDLQVCDDKVCLLPQQVRVEAMLPVLAAGATAARQNEALFAGFSETVSGESRVAFDLFGWTFGVDTASASGWVLLLLVAGLGGFLLNFTPCVLPVIPIKIMSLANTAGNRARTLTLGAAMSFGIVAFWLALALLVVAVSGFTATNQLFQIPAFTIGVGLVIAFMAVAMTGAVFVRLPNFVYALNPSQETHGGSFGLGIMTAILSTPCTAPFMGAAAAWAATQHPAATLGTFGAIGAGMAMPYLVLAAFPGLVRRMPRSGPAGDLIKQTMAFFMMAAAAYFVGVGLSALFARAPDPPSRLYWWVVMGFVAFGGLWLAARTARLTRRPGPRITWGFLGAGLALLAVTGAVRLTDEGPIPWVFYTPERLRDALAADNVVVLDFTAEWCLNCKSLEHGVLNSPGVARRLAGRGVVPMKVDITGHNPAGKAKLKETGRLTIPLLVVLAPDGTEILKSDFYTADQVVEAVEAARGPQGE